MFDKTTIETEVKALQDTIQTVKTSIEQLIVEVAPPEPPKRGGKSLLGNSRNPSLARPLSLSRNPSLLRTPSSLQKSPSSLQRTASIQRSPSKLQKNPSVKENGKTVSRNVSKEKVPLSRQISSKEPQNQNSNPTIITSPSKTKEEASSSTELGKSRSINNNPSSQKVNEELTSSQSSSSVRFPQIKSR